MKEYIIGLLLVLSVFLGIKWYTSTESLKAEKTIVAADRQYWWVAANKPSIACRVNGGEYRMTGFMMHFGGADDTFSYACEDRKQ